MSAGERESKIEMSKLPYSGVRKPCPASSGRGAGGTGDGGGDGKRQGDKNCTCGSEPRFGNVGRGRIRSGRKVRIASKCYVDCNVMLTVMLCSLFSQPRTIETSENETGVLSLPEYAMPRGPRAPTPTQAISIRAPTPQLQQRPVSWISDTVDDTPD